MCAKRCRLKIQIQDIEAARDRKGLEIREAAERWFQSADFEIAAVAGKTFSSPLPVPLRVLAAQDPPSFA